MKKLIFLTLIAFAIISCNETNNNSDNTTTIDTTTAPVDTTTAPVDTTSVSSVRYYGLRIFGESYKTDIKYYTTTQLSSGQCFCSGGGIKYISAGRITDVTGLTEIDGTVMNNCLEKSPCD